MNELRLSLRLARREVLRRPGRTALVALLVAIPVAGMTIAITLVRSEAETPAEDWEQQWGQADAVAQEEPQALQLPEGSRVVTFQGTYGRLKEVSGRRTDGQITNLPLGDPITEGIYEVVDGRPAAAAGEVVLTTALADRFDVHTGDRLRLERPALDLEVVGEAESSSCLRCVVLLLHGDLDGIDAVAGPYGGIVPTAALIDLPAELTEEERFQLVQTNQLGLNFRADALMGHYAEVDGDRAVRWSLVAGGVVLMVVAIVISAAFAVGARRQLVTVGQLSASGASPAHIRTSLLLQGTVTGLVGSVLGVALALVLLLAFRGTIEWHLDQRLRSYELPVGELLWAVVIGTAAATASALVPARTAARIPTLAALAGRRPLSPVSGRLVSWGFAGVAVGLALLFLAVLGSQGDGDQDGDTWAYVAIAGGAFELFGACALAPAIVARLEPLSSRLGGAARLGARALARHRARTGAVVSAVAAAGALAVVAGSAVLGSERQQGTSAEIPDDVVVATVERLSGADFPTPEALPDSVRRQLLDAFPGSEPFEVRAVRFTDPESLMAGWEVVDLQPDDPYVGATGAYVADEALLDAIRADAEIRSGLRRHGTVILSPEARGRDVVVRAPNGRELPARVARHRHHLGYYGNVLVTPAVVGDLGVAAGPAGAFLRLPEPLDDEGRDRLEDLMYDIDSAQGEGDAYVQVAWQYHDGGPTPLQLELILTGVALIFCLFVVGVSLALAAAEGKDESDVLAIAGAPPGVVARSAGARAWLMATLGAAIAVPIGFLPVVVVSWASGRDPSTSGPFPIVFPTRTVALLLLAVPLVVGAVAWCASSTAQRLRPVRVSTATFE